MHGKTILVVMAHPDDAELTCAGSVARWIREGDRAVLVVASDGARGGKHQDADHQAMAPTRQAEQQASANLIGFDEAVYLGFPDGDLRDEEALRGALVGQIRRVRPDVAMVMDPLTVIFQDSYVNHRDHRVLGMAMLDALYPAASNAGYFPEQLEAGLPLHKVPELLLAATERPNYWVDISDMLEVRFEALRYHASQIRLWPNNGEVVIEQQRREAETIGAEHGYRYAEAFRRVVVNPLT